MRTVATCCVLMLSACGAKEAARDPGEPFTIELGKCASWTDGREGYDPDLPGYHISGGAASITLRSTGMPTPEHLVLAIAISNLEVFNMSTGDRAIRSYLSKGLVRLQVIAQQGREISRSKRGDFFTCEVVGKEMHVTFESKAMTLFAKPCTVTWIDFTRG
jgi:hypothetical protein